MTNKIQKVETEIMDCWRVVDDVDVLLQYFGDDEFFTGMKPEHADKIMNLMLGVKELYSVKFERLWSDEMHKRRQLHQDHLKSHPE